MTELRLLEESGHPAPPQDTPLPFPAPSILRDLLRFFSTPRDVRGFSLVGRRELQQDPPVATCPLFSVSGKCPRIPRFVTLGDYCSTPAAAPEEKKKQTP